VSLQVLQQTFFHQNLFFEVCLHAQGLAFRKDLNVKNLQHEEGRKMTVQGTEKKN
jgi:hypothetical protein